MMRGRSRGGLGLVMLAVVVLCVAGWGGARSAAGDEPSCGAPRSVRPWTLAADGEVYGVIVRCDIAYVSGTFSRLARPSGGLAIVSAENGILIAAGPAEREPAVPVAADSRGGVYVQLGLCGPSADPGRR